MKALLKDLLYSTGLSQLSLDKLDRKVILNYHHVLSDHLIEDNLFFGYTHAASNFDKQMKFLSERYKIDCDIGNSNSITITFDDGGLNNYATAKPILDTYGIKAWFFINRIGTRGLWFDRWYAWFSYVGFGSYTFGSTRFDLKQNHDRRARESECWNYLMTNYSDRDSLLSQLIAQFDPFDSVENVQNPERSTSMSIDQLNELRKDGHRIGFHTNNHEYLSRLDDPALEDELTPDRQTLNALTDKNVIAIPFGDRNSYNPKVVERCKSKGYDTVMLNHPNNDSFLVGRMGWPNTPKPSDWMFQSRRDLTSVKK